MADNVFSIEIEGLTKRFIKKKHRGIFGFLKKDPSMSPRKGNPDVTVALNNVDLKIRAGELFGLLGPNGSGKTTLIKCLSTILIPDEGRVTVNGFDVKKETSMVRASFGMVVGGERTLYWKLTARDNLMYFSSLYKMPRAHAKKRVEELLETFQLSDRADERLEDYSSGMRQKVAIARALLHDPPILLFDEPTLGLDPNFSRQLRNQIREISEKFGKTVLLTTHYMDEAEQLLVEVAVYSPPVGIETYIRSMLPEAELIKLIQGNEAEGTPSKIKIIGVTVEEHAETIIDALRQKKVRIGGLNVEAPTLEDVFIKLTGSELKAPGV